MPTLFAFKKRIKHCTGKECTCRIFRENNFFFKFKYMYIVIIFSINSWFGLVFFTTTTINNSFKYGSNQKYSSRRFVETAHPCLHLIKVFTRISVYDLPTVPPFVSPLYSLFCSHSIFEHETLLCTNCRHYTTHSHKCCAQSRHHTIRIIFLCNSFADYFITHPTYFGLTTRHLLIFLLIHFMLYTL